MGRHDILTSRLPFWIVWCNEGEHNPNDSLHDRGGGASVGKGSSRSVPYAQFLRDARDRQRAGSCAFGRHDDSRRRPAPGRSNVTSEMQLAQAVEFLAQIDSVAQGGADDGQLREARAPNAANDPRGAETEVRTEQRP